MDSAVKIQNIGEGCLPLSPDLYGFLCLVESISVDPVYLFVSMAATRICVPMFHIWQPAVSK